MAVERYEEIRFRQSSISLIETANAILAEYEAQGLTLTVRQIYYQLVSRDCIANTIKEYGKISRLLNDGRMAGLIDWDMIEDRTRTWDRVPSWDSGKDFLQSVAEQFHIDMWEGQKIRPFCVVEKDALSGVLSPTCTKYDVPLLAAKGYCSVSTLREFSVEDLIPATDVQDVVILHLGDHDPSGIDMTRDINDRVTIFMDGLEPSLEVVRLALNMDQVQALNPPPNPAKTTDRRFADYARKYGKKSWELDALRPDYMASLVEKKIREYIDFDKWKARKEEINFTKSKLRDIADGFDKGKEA